LHDHDADRQRGDDPVPCGEPEWLGRHARRVFAHERAPHLDLVEERTVRRGVVAVDAAAEHRNRGPARLERTLVRACVDAQRTAARDDESRHRDAARKRPSDIDACYGRPARADDRNPPVLAGEGPAAIEDPDRRVVQAEQRGPVLRGAGAREARASAQELCPDR
jgi:hypothetical protein